MANNINWGKIYNNTSWGVGVTTNTISWGKSYLDLANSLSLIVKGFIDRVEADGGVLEALGCLKTDFPYIPTSSAITAILTPLKARSTYYENEVGTIKTLQSLENCKS